MVDAKIKRLKERHEQQMAQLGQQRQRNQHRLEQLQRRQHSLSQALERAQSESAGINPMSWQNRSHWQGQLIPAQGKVLREQQLAQQELNRVGKLWQNALSKRQGLAWLEQHRLQQHQAGQRRAEQRQQDESGLRAAGRHSRSGERPRRQD
ncbi:MULTISPECIES: flagellar FliJ family protein [Ferrimonas]|uniref:flagellar FliJ family protein n=1 Tax=Ferrimonas TaxID=44011 RepID=UPI0004821F73|nr:MULTISPECIES: flagellar FliJ family protein [Ferrimonas]USD36268.1 flagellar FliJ family protein [Ferrimonas sp. SCSIO 43195]